MGKQWKQWQTLFSWAPKSLQIVTAAMKLRHLLLGRKAMTNLDSILKSRDITLPTKVRLVKARALNHHQKRKSAHSNKDPGQSVQFSPVAQLCPTLCDPMDCSMPGFPVHHQLRELAQTHVHQVSDAIQPSHPLLSLFPPTFSHSQHQGLFKWVSSSHQVAKVLEFQLQHQTFQWTFRTDFL